MYKGNCKTTAIYYFSWTRVSTCNRTKSFTW